MGASHGRSGHVPHAALVQQYRDLTLKEVSYSIEILRDIFSGRGELSPDAFDEVCGHMLGDTSEHWGVFQEFASVDADEVLAASAVVCRDGGPEDRLRLLFSIFADATGRLDRDRLAALLDKLTGGLFRLVGHPAPRRTAVEACAARACGRDEALVVVDFLEFATRDEPVQVFLAEVAANVDATCRAAAAAAAAAAADAAAADAAAAAAEARSGAATPAGLSSGPGAGGPPRPAADLLTRERGDECPVFLRIRTLGVPSWWAQRQRSLTLDTRCSTVLERLAPLDGDSCAAVFSPAGECRGMVTPLALAMLLANRYGAVAADQGKHASPAQQAQTLTAVGASALTESAAAALALLEGPAARGPEHGLLVDQYALNALELVARGAERVALLSAPRGRDALAGAFAARDAARFVAEHAALLGDLAFEPVARVPGLVGDTAVAVALHTPGLRCLQIMLARQVRRLAVVNEDGRLCGSASPASVLAVLGVAPDASDWARLLRPPPLAAAGEPFARVSDPLVAVLDKLWRAPHAHLFVVGADNDVPVGVVTASAVVRLFVATLVPAAAEEEPVDPQVSESWRQASSRALSTMAPG